jgi:hypothetical protein
VTEPGIGAPNDDPASSPMAIPVQNFEQTQFTQPDDFHVPHFSTRYNDSPLAKLILSDETQVFCRGAKSGYRNHA